jgi:uncharacterized protein YgbK (DUF1537 family)
MTPMGGLVVLDDDPTGTQAVAGVPVLVDISAEFLHRWFAGHQPQPVYVLTNTRALKPAEARRVVARVVAAARSGWPRARFVCRGDSTLRGHVLEEYQGVAGGAAPVLLLAPAMPHAGRVTEDGRHYLITAGARIALSDTEYARDPDFGYADSALLAWAEERSGGLLAAGRGTVVPLARLRHDGAPAVVSALAQLSASGWPAACACDAETNEDLAIVARALQMAWEQGISVAVRCAPTLAALLAGRLATAVRHPPADRHRLLVVVGSYVQASTGQLAELARRHPGRVVETDLAALLARPRREQDRLTGALQSLWDSGPVAVLATPRSRPAPASGPAGLAIAQGLAGVLAALPERPDAVLARGGITSAVVAREGLGMREAWAAGPVRPGVAMWQADTTPGAAPLLIAAGNVGEPADLADLVEEMVSVTLTSRAAR